MDVADSQQHFHVHDPNGLGENLFIELVIPKNTNISENILGARNASNINQAEASINKHSMITRHKLKQNPALASDMALVTQHAPSSTEPKTYKSALKIPCWFRAMEEEIHALNTNQTWSLVPRPKNVNVIGSKWIFRTKFKEDVTVDLHKARLVAQGFSQVEGLDFEETFRPVVKPTTIRLILVIAVTLNWTMRQLDVKNVFLHGFLKETIYMEQPPGFKSLEQPDHVCKLQRSLYGLKQAPRACFDRLSQFLLYIGFTCSKAGSSLFIYKINTIIVLMLVYVDDVVIIGNNNDFINNLIHKLSTEFALKDLGRLHYFLGLEIKYISGGIFIAQSKYIKDLLCRAKMLSYSYFNTPMAIKDQHKPRDNKHTNPTEYRQLVGALQYLTFSRPDIVQAVNKVCQKFLSPTIGDLSAVKRILRYLKGTMDYELRFISQSSLTLNGFCDAYWGGCKTT